MTLASRQREHLGCEFVLALCLPQPVLSFLFFHVLICLLFSVCICVCVPLCACRGQRPTCRCLLSFHCMDSRDKTQIIRLGSKYLYPPSHLASLIIFFLTGYPGIYRVVILNILGHKSLFSGCLSEAPGVFFPQVVGRKLHLFLWAYIFSIYKEVPQGKVFSFR